jgi:hypothetical protein
VIAEKPLLQIVTSWDRLRQVLLKVVDRQRYHFGHAFERVEQDGNGVRVHFANGRGERADLLVACDGFRSSVRARLAPDVQPIYSGCYIWRGAPNESDLSPETRETIFPYMSFFLADQLQALGYPISGIDDELRIVPPALQFRLVSGGRRRQVEADARGRSRLGVRPRGTGGGCSLDTTSSYRFWRLESWRGGAGRWQRRFRITMTSIGRLLPTTLFASRQANASSRTAVSSVCSLASASRPMKIAGWQNYSKRPREL